jgi:Domain of unknown function (DUF4157)
MKLSPELHHEIERFFRFYYHDQTLVLPEVQIYVRRGARYICKIAGAHGITFGRQIFISPKIVWRNSKNHLTIPKDLLVHELTHTLQYEKQGFFGFLFSYLKAYFANLRGKKKWDIYSRVESYLQIPHEIEARDSAERFIEWFYSEAFSSSSVNISK